MVDHDHKILFYNGTKVVECPRTSALPLYGFKFANYKKVLKFEVNMDLALDVIGVLHSCGKIQHKIVNGRPGKLISFDLESINGERLECSLWDTLADQLSDHVAKHDNNLPIVVIINLGRAKEFMSRAQITNCYYGTRILLDANISEVESFRKSYMASKDGERDTYAIVEKQVYSMIDDFLVRTPKKKIGELRDINMAGQYIVVGTIVGISLAPGWCYLACSKCLSAVESEDDEHNIVLASSNGKSIGVWKCEKCVLSRVDAVRRFRVEVRVEDSTGSAAFILFDREVSRFVKKSAEEIYAQLPVGQEEEFIPQELQVFIKKQYAFKVTVLGNNSKIKQRIYTAMRMTNAKEVMDKLVDGPVLVEEAEVKQVADHTCAVCEGDAVA